MKSLNRFFVFLLCFCASTVLFAYDKSSIVSVLDVNRVVFESKAAKQIDKSLSSKYSKRRQDIIDLQKALERKMSTLQRDAAIMQQSKKESLQTEIKTHQRNLQRQQQDFQQDVTTERNKLLQSFFEKLRKVVKKYSDDHGIDLVLQKDVVPFSNERVDITNDIIKQFNANS